MAPTKNFPPKPTFTGSNGESGSDTCWVTACGIDDLNADGAGVTKVSLYVMTGSTKKVEDLSVRYYFSTKGMKNPSNVTVSELYDQAATEAAPANGTISGPYKYDKMDDVYYAEIKWSDYNIANSGKKYQFTVGLYYGDSWNPADDWSYQGLKMYEEDNAFFATGTEAKTDNICVYSGDKLVGGTEPDGTKPETIVTEPTPDPDPVTYPVYPKITKIDYSEQYHQIRFTWDKVEGATNYGIAVYLAGKWRIQAPSITALTYTTPKNLTPGKSYKVAIAAKVKGEWTAVEAIKHAVTVTVK